MHVLCSIAWFKFVSERIALSQIVIRFALSVTSSCVTTPVIVMYMKMYMFSNNMANLSALGCRIIDIFIMRASECQLTTIVKIGHEEM